MERLPLQIQTAYAELLEQLMAREAQRAIGHAGGSIVRKSVKGNESPDAADPRWKQAGSDSTLRRRRPASS